ncbi:hypothetical protein FRC02_007509 [Tulasnella sp. 418]|nr:hypothetical protein FRC02_007509 [Tulasnella sp. 418]
MMAITHLRSSTRSNNPFINTLGNRIYRNCRRQYHVAYERDDMLKEQGFPRDFFSNQPPAHKSLSDMNGKRKGRPEGNGKSDGPERVSDMEWELRVGRAIFLLQSTLPDFFSTGLVTSSHSSRTRNPTSTEHDNNGDDEIIYSKNIRLSYTPPIRLPPLPATFHIEGLALYQASAAVLRTSLMTLYSNCTVDIVHTSVVSPAKRERQLKLGITIQGRSRLTGSTAEWDVRTTYSFSPLSGLILHHEIQSIDPAPHSRVYDAFRLSLMRVLGGDNSPTTLGVGGSCKVPTSTKPPCFTS